MRTGGLPIGKEKPGCQPGRFFLLWGGLELFGKNGQLAMIEGENRMKDHVLNATTGCHLNRDSERICPVIDAHRGIGTMGVTIGEQIVETMGANIELLEKIIGSATMHISGEIVSTPLVLEFIRHCRRGCYSGNTGDRMLDSPIHNGDSVGVSEEDSGGEEDGGSDTVEISAHGRFHGL
jgi:hypothetical protein